MMGNVVEDPHLQLRALRGRLNARSYFLPLGENSASLVARLLADLERAAQRLAEQRRTEETGRGEILAVQQEVEKLEAAIPQLIKESSQLHRQLLEDSVSREERRQRLAERTREAEATLLHLQQLTATEELRRGLGAEGASQLRHRLSAIAAARGPEAARRSAPRPSIAVHGRRPPPSVAAASAEGGGSVGSRAAARISSELAEEVVSAAAGLAAQRRDLASAAGAMAAAAGRARAARGEERRLAQLLDAGAFVDERKAVTSAAAVEGELQQREEQLERACRSWSSRRDGLSRGLAEAREVLEALRSREELLRSETDALRREAVAQNSALEAAEAESHAVAVADTLEQRAQAAAQAALEADGDRLTSRLTKLRVALVGKAEADEAAVEAARAALEAPRRQVAPAADTQFRRSPEGLARTLSLHRARCAELSARLAAVRTHEASQERLAATREEEAIASRRLRETGLEESGALDSRLHELEAAVLVARGEAVALRACSEEASAEHLQTGRVRAAAAVAERSLAAEFEEQQARQERVLQEVQQVRTRASDEEALAQSLRREEVQLHSEAAELRRRSGVQEQQLAAAQRAHRELSGGVGPAVAELARMRARQQAEVVSQSELHMLIDDASRDFAQASRRLSGDGRISAVGGAEAADMRRALSRAEASVAGLELSEAESRQAMEERLRVIEPSLRQMQLEVARLAAERPQLLEAARQRTVAAGRATALAAEARAAEVATTAEASIAARSAAEERLHGLELQLQEAAATERQLAKDVTIQREALARADALAEELHAEAMTAHQELAAVEAAAAAGARRLADLAAAGEVAGHGLAELQEQRSQLAALLAGLASTREQLGRAVAEAEDELQEEEARGAELLAGPPALRQRLQVLASEAAALRHTTESVEADEAELSALARERRREVGKLKVQLSQLQAAGAELQLTLDRLRHTAQRQQGEWDIAVQEVSASESELEADSAGLRRLEAQVLEQEREAAGAMADLVHMTKENQLLHEQLKRVQQREAALMSATSQRQALELPRIQELKGSELECESAVHAYRKVLEERERNAAALADLAARARAAEREAEDARTQLLLTTESEEAARTALIQSSSELLMLKGYLSEAARALERQALDEEQVGAERARLNRALSTRQVEINLTVLGRAQADAETQALQREVEHLQRDLQEDVRVSLASAQQSRQQAEARHRHLQSLLAQQRQVQRRLEIEGEQLRSLLRFPPDGTGGAAAVHAPSVAEMPLASPVDAAAAALRTTLDEQGCLIQEMRAELSLLEGELERLHHELAAAHRYGGSASARHGAVSTGGASGSPG